LPGILVAGLLLLTVPEPVRGLLDKKKAQSNSHTLKEVAGLLWNRRSFRHMAIGAGLQAFVLYSMASWMASFIIRSHGMSTSELGLWLAMILGVGGAIGVLGGGIIGDRMILRDKRWYMWLPVIVGLISVPFSVFIYLADNGTSALIFAIIPGTLATVFLGPTIAAVHGLVGVRMRALSSAIVSLIVNLIGLGAGPFIIGFLSDSMAPKLGTESLRYAMLYVLPLIQFWCVCHFFLAARTLREDLAAAPD